MLGNTAVVAASAWGIARPGWGTWVTNGAASALVAAMLVDLHQRQETVLVVVTHNTGLAARCPVRFELVGQRLERITTA